MTNEEAIGTLENAKKFCYGDNAEKYEEALTMAIRSLQAWKEVLQELEDIKEDVKESNFEYCIGKLNGLNKAIDIINRKLAEIEEVR